MNIVSDSSRYQDLSAESRIEQARHAEVLRQYEIKKRARSINVPTAPDDVKRSLREFGQPVTLFGEDHADRRERLREVIAGMQISGEESAKVQAFLERENEAAASLLGTSSSAVAAPVDGKAGTAQQKEVFYSPADESLIQYRKEIAVDSFERSRVRLESFRDILSNREETMKNSEQVYNLYEHSKDTVLNLSQFGDERPLTAIKYSPDGHYIATGSFGSEIKIWNSNDLSCRHKYFGHSDRVTNIAWQNMSHGSADAPVFASSSADGHVIVWDGRRFASSGDSNNKNGSSMDVDDETEDQNISHSNSTQNQQNAIDESFLASVQRARMPSYHHKIKVNANGAAVSSCAFHPHFPQLLAASCHDYSWRLYDIDHVSPENNQAKELLLQDGHVKECSALAFHPDGSLVMTGDAGGVSLLWDLRSGQMVQGFAGHVKKISSISFHPTNGFQVATGSLDNTVKIWDLRKKKLFYTIPAHSNLISDMTYSESGELLLTASFDGSLKIFGSRDFRLLRTLSGHNGKVMACDLSPDEKHVVSAGYDRTIKLWAHKSEF